MTYFHPRDFDAGQPMIPGLSIFRRFKSYYGIEISKGKLDNLINHYSFNILIDIECQLEQILL